MRKTYQDSLRKHPLFQLSEAHFQQLLEICRVQQFSAGETLFTEGCYTQSCYFILSGHVAVSQKSAQVRITLEEVTANQVIGENNVLEDAVTVSQASAVDDVKLIQINLQKLKKNIDYWELYEKLKENASAFIANNYECLLSKHVKALKKSLQREKLRATFSFLLFQIIVLISLYTLSLRYVVEHFNESQTVLFSLLALLLMTFSAVVVARRSNLPQSYFGWNFYNLKESLQDVAVVTVVLMWLFAGLKYMYIRFLQIDTPLFTVTKTWNNFTDIDLLASGSLLVTYVFYWFVQEYIARGTLQSSFYYFYEGSNSERATTAILLSNLIFAIFHAHTSLLITAITFATGLLWGYIYYRYKNLLCVILSHIILGLYVVYVLGIEEIVF